MNMNVNYREIILFILFLSLPQIILAGTDEAFHCTVSVEEDSTLLFENEIAVNMQKRTHRRSYNSIKYFGTDHNQDATVILNLSAQYHTKKRRHYLKGYLSIKDRRVYNDHVNIIFPVDGTINMSNKSVDLNHQWSEELTVDLSCY